MTPKVISIGTKGFSEPLVFSVMVSILCRVHQSNITLDSMYTLSMAPWISDSCNLLFSKTSWKILIPLPHSQKGLAVQNHKTSPSSDKKENKKLQGNSILLKKKGGRRKHYSY